MGIHAHAAVVTSTNGPISGTTFKDTNVFLGVPFTAPPIGALRIEAPVPPTPWTAPLNTTNLRPCLNGRLPS